MKCRLNIIFLSIVWTHAIAFENVRAEEPILQPELSLPIGERLTYKVTWLWIPVGFGEVWVKEKTVLDGREAVLIVGLFRTNQILSKIWPMHDEAQSWVDAKTFESLQFEKEIKEILIKTHEKLVFDAAAKKGHFESFKTGEKNEFDIVVPVHDVLSVFYWLRRQALVPDESVKTMLVADQDIWELEAHVLGSETVDLHGEKIETLRVEPVTRVKGKVRRGMAWFYVTADNTRVPIRIVYKAPFGKIVGTLEAPTEDQVFTP